MLSIFSLWGCKKNNENPPVSGGVIDKTDYNAPKVIQSKDIKDFSVTFYPQDSWLSEGAHRAYTFEIKEIGGKLTATEAESKISFPADEKLLAALQTVIDEHSLADKNGIYRVTAGLPPEFQECSLEVNYESGESLKFTENNDPRAEWSRAVFTVFADWFAEKGDNSLATEIQD